MVNSCLFFLPHHASTMLGRYFQYRLQSYEKYLIFASVTTLFIVIYSVKNTFFIEYYLHI